MIAPNVEASVAANGVRQNVLACQEETSPKESTSLGERKKRGANCVATCSNTEFTPFGANCFYFSTTRVTHSEAVVACQAKGAQLVTINDQVENDFILNKRMGWSWIGLNSIEEQCKFVWQRGPSPRYSNWARNFPTDYPNARCVHMQKTNNNKEERKAGDWINGNCNKSHYYFVSSMSATTVEVVSACEAAHEAEACCPSSDFKLAGNKCFITSQHPASLDFSEAAAACKEQGAVLASINGPDEDEVVDTRVFHK